MTRLNDTMKTTHRKDSFIVITEIHCKESFTQGTFHPTEP